VNAGLRTVSLRSRLMVSPVTPVRVVSYMWPLIMSSMVLLDVPSRARLHSLRIGILMFVGGCGARRVQRGALRRLRGSQQPIVNLTFRPPALMSDHRTPTELGTPWLLHKDAGRSTSWTRQPRNRAASSTWKRAWPVARHEPHVSSQLYE
jgi:hypothetical protein